MVRYSIRVHNVLFLDSNTLMHLRRAGETPQYFIHHRCHCGLENIFLSSKAAEDFVICEVFGGLFHARAIRKLDLLFLCITADDRYEAATLFVLVDRTAAYGNLIKWEGKKK